MSAFHKFPSIHHLAWLGDEAPRDEKVVDVVARRAFLGGEVRIEEKIDGANLGISFDAAGNLHVQNRGSELTPGYSGQFKSLSQWLSRHQDDLFDVLTNRLQLFGEWCALTHSVQYTELPAWFVAFDVYDFEAAGFWSAPRRNALLLPLGVPVVPEIARGIFSLPELSRLLDARTSQFGAPRLEGIVLRRESSEWLLDRAKLVRAGFTKGITTHWRRKSPQANRVSR